MNYSEIEQKINENKSVDFGDILNKSFELFKKTWQQGLLHMLLSIAVVLGVMAIVMVPMFAMGVFDPSAFEGFENGNPDFEGIILLYLAMFPAIFIAATFSMLLNAAFYRIVKQIDLEELESPVASFGMFFKSQYVIKAFVLSLLTMVIAIVAMLACYLPLFYVMIPLTFVVVVFAFNPDMSAMNLIKLSFKLGTKKWLVTFGLVIVSSILAEVVGLLLCGIGIFATASFIYLPTYYIYKEVIGFDDHISEGN
jgi:hypothetical protein